jgi:hypothetical protein
LLASALAISTIIGRGGAMAQQVKESPQGQIGKEALGLSTKITDLKNTFKAQFDAARSYAYKKEMDHYLAPETGNVVPLPYATVQEANRNLREPLIKTLNSINALCREYNVVPAVTPSDAYHLKQSANGGIAPSDANYLGTAALDMIKSQVDNGLGALAAEADSLKHRADSLDIVEALQDMTPAAPLTVHTYSRPLDTPSVSGIAGLRIIKPYVASPSPAVSLPQLSSTERERYLSIIQSLSGIIDAPAGTARAPGPTDAARKHAIELMADIGAGLAACNAPIPSQPTKLDAVRAINTIASLRAMALEYASAPEIQAALKAVKGGAVSSGNSNTQLLSQLSDANKELLDILGDSKRSAEEKDYANKILAAFKENVWLLSEDEPSMRSGTASALDISVSPRWGMFLHLRKAANLLNGSALSGVDNDYKTAALSSVDNEYKTAMHIFEGEQQQLAQRLDFVKRRLEQTLSLAETLPDRSQLLEMEQSLAIRTVAKNPAERDLIEAGRLLRQRANGKDNSRETFEATTNNRLNQINMAIATNDGRYSFDWISDLERTAQSDYIAMAGLTSLWNHALNNGLSTETRIPEKVSAWLTYANAAEALANPGSASFVPYDAYPKELRNILILQYRKATNNFVDPESKISQNISDALMRTPQYFYEDALYSVYNLACSYTPANADIGPLAQTLGGLNAARTLWNVYLDYGQYDLAGMSSPGILQARLADATYYVNTAIGLLENSGLAADDPRISAANKWLHLEIPGDDQGKKAYADMLWAMAIDMVSTREAQMWLANAGKIGRADQPGQASQVINAALRRFEDCFGVPESWSPQSYNYPELARSVSDVAIRSLLAPVAFQTTEVLATYDQLALSYEGSHMQAARIAAGKKELEFSALRSAQLQDRDMSFTTSTNAAAGHVRLMANVKADYTFGRPSQSASDEVLEADYLLLNRDVGKRPIVAEIPRFIPTLSICDRHRDQNLKPHERWAVNPEGIYFAEAQRQVVLNGDVNVPLLLRQFDASNFTDALREISRMYGVTVDGKAVTAEAQMSAINGGFMTILDAKIKMLEDRLNGSIVLDADGKSWRISDLDSSPDPRAALVRNAKADLSEVKALRAQYGSDMAANLFNGSMAMTPPQSIMTMEQALAGLTDENIKGIKPSSPVHEVELLPGPIDLAANRNLEKGVMYWDMQGHWGIPHVEFDATGKLLDPDDTTRLISLDEFQKRMAEEGNKEALKFRWMFTLNDFIRNPHQYEPDANGKVNTAGDAALILRGYPQTWKDSSTAYPVIRIVQTEDGPVPADKDGVQIPGIKAVQIRKGADKGKWVLADNNDVQIPLTDQYVVFHVKDADGGGYVTEERNRDIDAKVRDAIFKYGGSAVTPVYAGSKMLASVRAIRVLQPQTTQTKQK